MDLVVLVKHNFNFVFQCLMVVKVDVFAIEDPVFFSPIFLGTHSFGCY